MGGAAHAYRWEELLAANFADNLQQGVTANDWNIIESYLSNCTEEI